MLRHTLTTCAAVLVLAGAAIAGVVPGDEAPDFTLKGVDEETYTLSAYLEEGNIVVLEWFNPDCPFIKKHHANNRTMDETFAEVAGEGVVWLAINSNAPGQQGAGWERNMKAAKDYEMSFPVLMDESGEVGKAYGAKTTPHMFIITPDGKVAYAGAIDDDRSADKLGKTNYVAAALAEVIAGKPVTTAETKPYGCSVKYGKQSN